MNTIKKILATGLLVFLFSPIGFSQNPGISLDTNVAYYNNNISLPIYVSNFNNIGSITLYIHYDNTVMSWNGVMWNSQFSSNIPYINANNGIVAISWVDVNGLSLGSDTLGFLSFSFNGGTTDLTFASNCEITDPYGNVKSVNYTNGLVLEGLSVSIYSTSDTICSGDTLQLSASPRGGSGNYSYTWTSLPAGFNSTQQNPLAVPMINTQYMLVVTDGIEGSVDTIDVKIFSGSAPGAVTNMLPANNSIDITAPVNCSWSLAANATHYDLFIWVDSLSQPSSPEQENLYQLSYSLSGLGSGITYSWQVVSANMCYSVPGPTQKFTTKALPDLNVMNITNSTPISGQSMQISWEVKNNGEGATTGNWYDYVWLSPEIDVRIQEASNILLGQYSNLSYLASGQSYTQTVQVSLPSGYIGSYWLFVVSDNVDAYSPCSGSPQVPYNPPPFCTAGSHGGNLMEETTNNDNFFYKEIVFPVPPSPDLQVTSAIIPSASFSEQAINITWTVINQGEAAASSSSAWYDRIYISADTVFSTSSAVELGVFGYTADLETDSSYTRTETVTIPQGFYGTYYFYIQTDATDQVFEHVYEDNIFLTDSMTVILSPPPDLIVPWVSVTDTASNDESIVVSWNVQNQGASSTGSQYGEDKLYLTTSPNVDLSAAYLLGTRSNTVTLDPGGSYTASKTVVIPDDINGPYYLYVEADYLNDVFEHTSDTNNICRSDTSIHIVSPDLIPLHLNIPSVDSTSASLPFSFTLKNIGVGKAMSKQIEYKIMFSTYAIYHADSILSEITFTTTYSTLYPQDSVVFSDYFSLPDDLPGPFYVHMRVDSDNFVFENNNENNNSISSDTAIQVNRPDLSISDIQIPAADTSGNTIQIQYTIRNSGSGSTLNLNWKDVIYLSTSDQFYPDSVTDVETINYTTSLGSGDSMVQQLDVTIPHGYQGTYYIIVETDVDDEVYEKGRENNNIEVSSSAIQLTLGPWADLRPIEIQIPDTATIGFSSPFTFRVKNFGTKAAANISWRDGIFISSDPVWNSSNVDTLRIDLYYSLDVLPDSSYEISSTFNLPHSMMSGSYYLYVYTDDENMVYEYTDENNNIYRSNPFLVEDYPPVDLEVNAVTTATTVASGSLTNIYWTVENTGAATTLPAFWNDAVYLSIDTIYSPDSDIFLKKIQYNGSLSPGQTYSNNTSVQIPNGLSGPYYVIVRSDLSNLNYDSDTLNNAGMPRDQYHQPQAVTINLTPPPDLEITSLSTPLSGTSGQNIEAIFTVKNNGPGAIMNTSWADKFYLSSDFTIDNGDILLATYSKSGGLDSSASYTDTLQISIPITASGNYILIMNTDHDDAIYEHTAEGNNTSNNTIILTLPPPADLHVNSITVPDTAVVGDSMNISWQIRNIGSNAASGSMKDLLYVSDDHNWDLNDQLIGEYTGSISLNPYDTVSRSLTTILPGVSMGSKYLIVRTDMLNNIYETNDTNNTSASAESLYADMTELALETIIYDTLENNTDMYFRINIPDSLGGESLLSSLLADSLFGVNEMYLTHNSVSTRTIHDYSHTNYYQGNQEVLVPSLTLGDYYMLIYGSTSNGTLQPISLEANILEFDIRNVSPNQGGNTGSVTLMINGAKFDSLMDISLGKNNVLIPADTLYFIDLTKIMATFNLNGADTGHYDLVGINSAGDTNMLQNGFEVVQGSSPVLGLSTIYPSNARTNRIIAFTINFENTGNMDMIAPEIIVKSHTGAKVALNVDDLVFNYQQLSIPLELPEGPAGILRPGVTGSITVYTYSSAPLGFSIIAPEYF